MLLKEQEEYLQAIPDGAIAHVHSFDEHAREVALRLIEDLKIALPEATILHFGSTKTGIAGENEIDIGVIARDTFMTAKHTLSGMFGDPVLVDGKEHLVRWTPTREGFPVELFLMAKLSPRIQEYLDTQRLLEARGDLRSQLERLKFSFDGKSLRDYTKAKFEFFNSILHPRVM